MANKFLVLLTVGSFFSTSLGGCAKHYNSPQEAAAKACGSFGPRAMSGAAIGAAAGAGAGAAIGAAAGRNGKDAAIGALAGLLVGAIAGAVKGNELDARDCAAAKVALQQIGNTPNGNAVNWSSPSGSRGSFTPVSDTFQGPADQPCRKIQADYYMKGHEAVQNDAGLVCRNADGDWTVWKA